MHSCMASHNLAFYGIIFVCSEQKAFHSWYSYLSCKLRAFVTIINMGGILATDLITLTIADPISYQCISSPVSDVVAVVEIPHYLASVCHPFYCNFNYNNCFERIRI